MVVPPPAIPGLGQTGGFSFMLQQRESTDDIKAFEGVVKNFLAEVRKRPEITGAFSFFTASTPGYQLEVDREKVKKLGVSFIGCFLDHEHVYGLASTSTILPCTAGISG